MSEFVEECRREWRRLRVPDPVANEMAADLAADLKEAEVEGASVEEVLGNAAFDPRGFAASWALARGVLEPRSGGKPHKRLLIVALIVLAVLIAGGMLASALLVSTSRSHAPVLTARANTVALPTTTVAVVTVPDLLGLRLAQAAAGARRLGLRVSVNTLPRRNDRAAGIVVAQTPPAGTSLARGGTLSLTIRR